MALIDRLTLYPHFSREISCGEYENPLVEMLESFESYTNSSKSDRDLIQLQKDQLNFKYKRTTKGILCNCISMSGRLLMEVSPFKDDLDFGKMKDGLEANRNHIWENLKCQFV